MFLKNTVILLLSSGDKLEWNCHSVIEADVFEEEGAGVVVRPVVIQMRDDRVQLLSSQAEMGVVF